MGERVSRFAESVAIVREAWREGRVSFRGKHYQLETVVVTPRPLQVIEQFGRDVIPALRDGNA